MTSKPELQRKLKSLSQIIDKTPLLTPAMLRLTRWMSEYYICPWGDTLQTVLPARTLKASPARIDARCDKSSRGTHHGCRQAAQDHGQTTKRCSNICSVQIRKSRWPNWPQQCDCSSAPIHSLREKKLVIFTKRYIGEGVGQLHTGERDRPWQLNTDQQRALDVIPRAQQAGEHTTVVLHGVTGSGKTEVYMQAIAETLRFKRQAIILVPEISLTPQTRERFLARLSMWRPA